MRPKLSLIVVAAAAAVACSDSFRPTIDNVSGIYSVREFTTDSAGTTKDWVAAGATLDLTLAPNGTTTGRLFIPGAAEGGGDVDEDMAGTWTLTGSTIEFTQTADTFVRDVAWRADENRLSGDQTFSDTRVRVSLTK